jgi:hypothetical protein
MAESNSRWPAFARVPPFLPVPLRARASALQRPKTALLAMYFVNKYRITHWANLSRTFGRFRRRAIMFGCRRMDARA